MVWLTSCASSDIAPTSNDGPSGASTTGAGLGDGDEGDYPIYSTGSMGLGGSQGLGGAPPEESAPSCLRLASMGTPASFGIVPGSGGLDAMVDWLNQTSNVEAKQLDSPIQVTPDVLDQVDVVLLQDLADYAPSVGEIRLLVEWVEEGGAIVALSGFDGSGEGVAITNQLLSFSGLNFAVTENDTAVALSECGYCLGSSRKTAGFVPEHPISRDVESVGAFLGRSIQGDGQAVQVEDGKQLAVAKDFGDGHVFLYHDDWITNVAQWTGNTDQYCGSNPSCSSEAPAVSYQIAQLWYNVLRWAVPDSECLEMSDESVTHW